MTKVSTTARFACLALTLVACGGKLDALAPATPAGGPKIHFDLTARPLPDVPYPNDVAARADPSSPTGLRVNASLVAPTYLERGLRADLDQLDGWGTLSAITVSFDAPIDYRKLHDLQNDADPANDGVYLVNLVDGTTSRLDFDSGHFPLGLRDTANYFLDDPLHDQSNIVFPTTGPTPNFLHDVDPAWEETHTAPQMYDDLLTFWERATNTLIVRPVRPLKAETPYAVVLTDKVTDAAGRAVDSPFPGINHAAQTAQLAALPRLLPAGVTLDHVRFTWCFTTQSTTADLVALYEGLHGNGPLAWVADAAPVTVQKDGVPTSTMKVIPQIDKPAPEFPGNVSILQGSLFRKVMSDHRVSSLLICDPLAGDDATKARCRRDIDALLNTYDYIDYLVAGSYETPLLLNSSPPQDAVFHLDRVAGTIDGGKTVPTQTVYFWMAVPKASAAHQAPFPVAMYGHGYTSQRTEGILGFSGSLARQGVASIAIDSFGHGLTLSQTDQLLLDAVVYQYGARAFSEFMGLGRARDLDNDGIPDTGGDFWTADAFHTRDVVRQTVVDWMQAFRLLQSFDGKTVMRSIDGKGATSIAGDFNGDGVVDVGGPPTKADGTHNLSSDMFTWGMSLGGFIAPIAAAVDPAVSASAPTSGGAGLADVGIRSTQGGVVQAVFLEVMGPMIVSCKWDARAGDCTGGEPDALAWELQQVNFESRRVIARGAHVAWAAGDLVKVENLVSGAKKVQLVDGTRRVRIGIGADGPIYPIDYSKDPRHAIGHWNEAPGAFREGDRVRVTVCAPNKAGDDCDAAAPTKAVIDNYLDYQQDTTDDSTGKPVQAPVVFMGRAFNPGAPLIALARGFGFARQSPDLRRFMQLAQQILEPGDPGSYAPHFYEDLLPSRAGRPVNVMVVATVGDMNVPVNTGIEMARAAGLVDDKTVDPDYGATLDDVLINGHVVEGLAKLSRFVPDEPGYGGKAKPHAHVSCAAPGSLCDTAILLDPTGYSCDATGADCRDGFGAPRLTPPLRDKLAHPTCTPAQAATFDNCGQSALVMPYLNPTGQHTFGHPSPNKAFDMDTYMVNLVAHYFETRGKELVFDRCLAAEADLGASTWPAKCAFQPPHTGP